MVATLQQIIGKINPMLYAENGKELLKKYGSPENIPAEEVKPNPISEHRLVYDSSSETLEPIYFFILDLMNDMGLAPEKYFDSFSSSVGSGFFSEIGQKASLMQQHGTKLLGDVNTVLRSIINLIYDLREFNIRLQSYADLKSQDKNKVQAALLSLKQIWMDKVDINKGNSSIKAMALGQAGYQTLIDAYLVANNVEDADKLDLNERVKRIVKARIIEFNDWLRNSGVELKKRYEIEKTYLRSQVNSLKLYSRWAKPYLRAASELEMKEQGREANLVKVFDTLLLELTLMGKSKLKIKELALEGRLPAEFKKLQQKRDYFACVLVEFKFRGIPRIRQQSHYVFGGRADVSFVAYALNDDELNKINEELEKSDITDAFKLVSGITTEGLEQLRDDIEFFLEEEKEEQEEKFKDTSNPFVALIGGYNKQVQSAKTEAKKEQKKETKTTIVNPDTWIEKTHLSEIAKEMAEDTTFKIFDTYKKAHGMVSYT